MFTDEESQRLFDSLEIKRGDKLGCWVCGYNVWSARKVINDERQPASPALPVTYVQLICTNCKNVAWFTDKVLDLI